MKTAIRLFNVIILALSVVATIFLFTSATFSFNSNISLDVAALAKFVPETTYSESIDVVKSLGTDVIHVGIKFSLDYNGTREVMDGNREKINAHFITENVYGIVNELHEPIEYITNYSVKSVLKSTIKKEITEQIQAALEKYKDENPDKASELEAYTAETIMDNAEMDEVYFHNFSLALYNAADDSAATIDSVSNVLYEQIDFALAKAEDSSVIDVSSYTEGTKAGIKDNLVSILNQLKLVKDDGEHVKRISQIAYIYLSDYLVQELNGKVAESELERRTGEDDRDYGDRLLHTYVVTMMPDVFYQIIGYISLSLFIGMFVFAGIWIILILITLIKTFTKKPWTLFGPWFWIIGGLQLVLGLGLTVAGKFFTKNITFTATGIPLKSVILVPRTFALIPSLLFLAAIVLAFIYGFFKRSVKNQIKKENGEVK